jgi:hypothetical protein
MTAREASAKAKANTEILRCAQDESKIWLAATGASVEVRARRVERRALVLLLVFLLHRVGHSKHAIFICFGIMGLGGFPS